MNEQRNVDWSVVFAIAARAGSRELIRALTTAMGHETTAMERKCTALAEKYNASLAQQHAEFEQHYAALRRELFAKIDNELGPLIKTLRQELAAARAEIDRLRALQSVH